MEWCPAFSQGGRRGDYIYYLHNQGGRRETLRVGQPPGLREGGRSRPHCCWGRAPADLKAFAGTTKMLAQQYPSRAVLALSEMGPISVICRSCKYPCTGVAPAQKSWCGFGSRIVRMMERGGATERWVCVLFDVKRHAENHYTESHRAVVADKNKIQSFMHSTTPHISNCMPVCVHAHAQ